MSRFHKAFYRFMRTAIKPYFKLTGYKWERYDPKSPNYLVLTNHNTNWDFFLFGLILKKQMYFVASEHIFRKGFTSFIIRTLADPIPRKKGSDSDLTVKKILDRLAEGENVCMMADGNRSFSGETGFISPKTAQLVKDSGVGLVTLALHGGYFINPRWSKHQRKGPSWGRAVNEYTAEQLADMSVDEIYEYIKRDLYVNAYDDQRGKMYKYKCEKPAEGLESTLFYCPDCGGLSTMESCGDRFYCKSCGYTLRFNDFGFFEACDGGRLHYDAVDAWYHAELDYMRSWLEKYKGGSEELFSDEGLRLSLIRAGVSSECIAEGRLVMFADRLEVQTENEAFSFRLEDIQKISIALTDTMLFTANGNYYEIKPHSGSCCALKYLIASRLLIGKEYY